eukprot:gene40896-54149_t
MLETIKHINISAILLPTELGSFEVLKKGLDRRHFIYNANMKDRHRDRLKISLMAIPPIIYDKYGSINAELCSEESRAGWAKADVAMAYVKQQCLNSQLLVDLGAVAVSIPFLRKTGINFNNSIPDPTH